jgi:tyrosyl-DNA phosphodiesterase-1
MFFKRVDWASDAFPRELFHDSKSKRGGVLMHSKVWLPTLDSRVSALTCHFR